MPVPALQQPTDPPIRAELRLQTICLSMLTVLGVGFALYWLRPIMIPFVVAVFLSFALMPLVDALELHARLPRTIAVCVALLLALLVLSLTGWLVSISVSQIVGNADQYEEQIKTLLDWIASTLPWANSFIADIPKGRLQAFLLDATSAVWGVISQSFIVLIFLFFLLMSSVKRDRPIGGAWGEMESQIRAYLLTMTTLCAVTGMLVGAVLSLLGVQAAVLFGVLTFLLNFIPNVGSFIAILLPVPIVLLSPTFTLLEKGLAIGVPAVIQFMIGNFLQPKLMGNSMKMHPVTILLSLIFWSMLWGIVGMFLAVPITSIIKIACDRHALTRPVANLMAGRLDALRQEPVAEVSAQG